MKKIPKTALIVMAILTATYVIVVAYANANSGWNSNLPYPKPSKAKHPTEYGIWLHFIAEPTAQPFSESKTPEELGIILVQSDSVEDRFHIYIIDEEKALPWMRNRDYHFFSIEYEDRFYDVFTLHVTPGLPESVKQYQLPVGGIVGTGWIFTGALVYRWREKE